MPFDKTLKSGRPVSVANFKVVIPDIDLEFNIRDISEIDFGTFAEIQHRDSGTAGMQKENQTGTMTCANVTMTGLYLPDLQDVKKIEAWHRLTRNVPVNGDVEPGTRKKNIEVKTIMRNSINGSTLGSVTGDSFVLENCSLIKLSISGFSLDSADPSKWTMVVKPESVKTGGA